jgi:hypothetical protein
MRFILALDRNFSLGAATYDEAMMLGEDWVGPGYSVSRHLSGAWTSADELRLFRAPSWKKQYGIFQADFQRRLSPQGDWYYNGHLDIIIGPPPP